MSNNDKLMERIRKCLALSESANEHEAAAAMRQARKLMEKAGLTASDVGLFEITDQQVDVGYSRLPSWAANLSVAVAQAFACTAFHGQRQVSFVGPSACADVAGYCFEILLRQLKKARKEFIESRIPFAPPGKKRTLGHAFCFGWSQGISKTVQSYAAAITEQQRDSHKDYLQKVRNKEVGDSKRRRFQTRDDGSSWAASNGLAQGAKVDIHQGVAASSQPDRLSHLATEEAQP